MAKPSSLTNIINQLKVPPSYKPVSTTFTENNPELTSTFELTRKYTLTTPTTRAEALQQIVKTLALNPSDHRVVNIYDEQLNGTTSPLFDTTTGSRYLFSAKLEPSFDGETILPECKSAQTDDVYRACVNNNSRWGMNARVASVEITVEKVPR